MKFSLCLLLLALLIPLRAQVPAPPDVSIEQNLGAVLPLQSRWQSSEASSPQALGDFLGHRPAIVVLGYVDCPQLCSVTMNALVESLAALKPRVGEDFDVFFLSINPDESGEKSAAFRQHYMRFYSHPESAPGWHMLRGDPASIRAVTEAIGFHYEYDPDSGRYNHASGLVIITPEGVVSQYFYGIEFPPAKLDAALKTAAAEETGHPVRELLIRCSKYNPIRGRHGLLIWRCVQGAGALTVVALGLFIVVSVRRDRGNKTDIDSNSNDEEEQT